MKNIKLYKPMTITVLDNYHCDSCCNYHFCNMLGQFCCATLAPTKLTENGNISVRSPYCLKLEKQSAKIRQEMERKC